jgi:hypothetical protein
MNGIGFPFSFMPLLVVVLYLGFIGIGLYLAMLFANFMKAGIKAFNLYVEKNK